MPVTNTALGQEITYISALLRRCENDHALARALDLMKLHPERCEVVALAGLAALANGNALMGDKLTRLAETLDPALMHATLLDKRSDAQGITSPVGRGLIRLGVYLSFKSNDAFVLSYAKSGRTWLRALLGFYLLGPDTPVDDALQTAKICRDLNINRPFDFSHDDYAQWKTAGDVDTDKSPYQDKTVILLARDPRDVLVSFYFQYLHRGDQRRMGGTANVEKDSLSDFIRRERGGLSSLLAFMNAWALARSVPRAFHLVSYEDMQRDTQGELARVIDALDLPKNGAHTLEQAVNAAQFDAMRQAEQEGAKLSLRREVYRSEDAESFKARRGKVGGYKDYLSDADIAFVNDTLARDLDPFWARYKI